MFRKNEKKQQIPLHHNHKQRNHQHETKSISWNQGLIPTDWSDSLSGFFFSVQEALPGYVYFLILCNRSYLISTTEYGIYMETPESPCIWIFLLDNGNLLRPTESTKRALCLRSPQWTDPEIDRNGNVVWEFEYKSDQYVLHHGIWLMPNGNILASAFEKKTKAGYAGGYNPQPSSSMFGGGKWLLLNS